MYIPQPAVQTVTMEIPLVNPDRQSSVPPLSMTLVDSQINEESRSWTAPNIFDEDGDGWGVYDFICACQPQQGYEATQMGDCNDDPS